MTGPDIKLALERELRDLLAERGTGPGLLSLSLSITSLDAVEWLAVQALFPKVYWQGRGESQLYAGVGAALSLNGTQAGDELWADLAQFREEYPNAVLFGGLRFDPQRLPDAEWRDFGDGAFFLPSFLLVQDDADTRLQCHIVVPPNSSEASLLASLGTTCDGLRFDLPPRTPRPAAVSISSDEPDRSRFVQSVTTLTDLIAAGDVEKVVLARRMDVRFAGPVDPYRFVRHFKAMRSPAYFFCLQFTSATAFVGSSPERLYKRTGRHVCSEALAGTRRRGSTPAEDAEWKTSLERSPKDRHEHRLVHDHISVALAALCENFTAEEEPTVLQLVLVQHLLSQMSGTLGEGHDDTELLRALHPTPAVGGLPVQPALKLIRDLEPFDRGWYAAPLGRISRDEVDLTVAIRSGLLHGNTLSLYCGAGIVADSDPDEEWAETESKFANFLHVIEAE
ncbi:MAG: isochorismate synthase [Lentisphaerae bacterium]|nr:isochorismate synthase [Lentisphaerota bacterium]